VTRGRCWLLVAVTALAGACSDTPTRTALDPALQEPGQAQRRSLETIFYRGNPLPPMPDAAEVAAASRQVAAASPWERELLEALYPDDPESWALALRDSDHDGIKDYRVSDYYGRWLEGDTDIDGDGIDNTFDARPYEPDPGRQRPESLPPHISWRALGHPDAMATIQQRLFSEHGILLVERSAAFTPELARAAWDAVATIGGKRTGTGEWVTLDVIATVGSSLLRADAEEGAGDFAQLLPATRTMEIYRAGIESPPLVQLGFLVHELAHAVQFALDFNEDRRLDIVVENRFESPNFDALVANFGWSTRPVRPDPEANYELFRPQYVSVEALEYLYLGDTPAEWAAWLAAIYDETGAVGYLEDPRIVGLHILGDYSLTSPWEWYSDHVIAYVYLALFDAVARRCGPDAAVAIERAVQAEVLSPAWPYFRFRNARGDPFQAYIAARLALPAHEADRLAQDYLPACTAGETLSRKAPLRADRPFPGGLGRDSTGSRVRDDFAQEHGKHVPFVRREGLQALVGSFEAVQHGLVDLRNAFPGQRDAHRAPVDLVGASPDEPPALEPVDTVRHRAGAEVGFAG
jgi:hypothetical protein